MVRVLRRQQLQTLSVEADPVEVRVVGIASSFLTDGLEVDRPRVLVDAEKINDSQATVVARDIAKSIEQQMTYPGEVKVTVLREMRVIEYAR